MTPDLASCGSASFFLVFLGIAGFVASLFSLVFAWAGIGVARRLAPATALLGIVAFGVGAQAGRGLQTRVNELIVEMEGSESAAPPPDADGDGARYHRDNDRGRRVADLRLAAAAQAKHCQLLGIESGSMPVLAGILGTAIAYMQRRRSPEPGPA